MPAWDLRVPYYCRRQPATGLRGYDNSKAEDADGVGAYKAWHFPGGRKPSFAYPIPCLVPELIVF